MSNMDVPLKRRFRVHHVMQEGIGITLGAAYLPRAASSECLFQVLLHLGHHVVWLDVNRSIHSARVVSNDD